MHRHGEPYGQESLMVASNPPEAEKAWKSPCSAQKEPALADTLTLDF